MQCLVFAVLCWCLLRGARLLLVVRCAVLMLVVGCWLCAVCCVSLWLSGVSQSLFGDCCVLVAVVCCVVRGVCRLLCVCCSLCVGVVVFVMCCLHLPLFWCMLFVVLVFVVCRSLVVVCCLQFVDGFNRSLFVV